MFATALSGRWRTMTTDDKPKFTPGPWRVERREFDFDGNCDISVSTDELLIADIYSDDVPGMANAALIAAAPEMYAYLERHLRTLNPEGGSAQMIRRILAKARGEDAK